LCGVVKILRRIAGLAISLGDADMKDLLVELEDVFDRYKYCVYPR
jgi:hypothetical protein